MEFTDTIKEVNNVVIESSGLKNEPVSNTCVVGIASSTLYDTSIFPNNANTFYTQISYKNLNGLSDHLQNLINGNETDAITDLNLLYIVNCFKDPNIKMIFRFLCSSDCHGGESFGTFEQNLKIYKFVKLVTTRDVIIEFSDHSMGAFFKNWTRDEMGIDSPIEILPNTHNGPYKMIGSKDIFMNSIHPTLKQIGDLSSSNEICITFENAGGTRIYRINEDNISNVKLISRGHQLESIYTKFGIRQVLEETGNEEQEEQEEQEIIYEPVHCEFNYGSGMIVVSATHWCNLQSVESDVDINTLRRYYTDTLGAQATQDLDDEMAGISDPIELKRAVSNSVRQLSSGGEHPRKLKRY